MQAFEAAHATGQGDMQSVLQATFTSLDEGFLADTHYSSMVRCTKHRQNMQHPLTASQLLLCCRIVQHQLPVGSLYTLISRLRSCGGPKWVEADSSSLDSCFMAWLLNAQML